MSLVALVRTCFGLLDATRRRPAVRFAMTVLAISAAAAAPINAQQTVTLLGHITDANGAPIEGVAVVLRNPATGLERSTQTSEQGAFVIVGVPPGAYEVTAERLGYGRQQRNIELLLGQRAEITMQLTESAIALQELDVTAQEGSFEIQRTDVSAPVVQEEIENLPLNTRNAVSLAGITPGVKSYAPVSGRSLPTAGAEPSLRFWNFHLDGVEWKSMFNGNLVGIPQTGSPIPQEALREFRVLLNPYDAEYTRAASFVISALTHRGTNEFHGSGFIYEQNNDLRALNHFQREAQDANPETFSRADYSRQQLGFNVRGPIVRDQLFFSASYELNNTTNAIDVVPGRPSFDPGLWDEFAGTYSAPTKNHAGMIRLTASPVANHTFDGIWAGRIYSSETNFGGTRPRQAGISADYAVHSVQLRDTYTPSPTIVNEASLHFLYWFHDEAPLVPGPQRSYPSIRFGTSNFPLELKETVLRAVNKLTYTPRGGNHVIKAGIELARVNTDSYLPDSKDGAFLFETDTSSLPYRATIGVGFYNPSTTEDARVLTDGWVVGGYVQDDWRALPNLTLSFGVRYDAEINTLNNDFTVPFAADQALTQLLPPNALNRGDRKNDLNNIAPRVAFSWDVFSNGRTFLRGGYGLMYDRVAGYTGFFEKLFASWRTYTFENPGTTDPEVLRQRVIQGEGATSLNLTLMTTDIEAPQSHQMSLGFGHRIVPELTLNMDLIARNGSKLYYTRQLNPLIPSEGRRLLTDDYGSISIYDDIGETRFRALTSELVYDRPSARLRAAYTLGWYEDNAGGYSELSSFRMQRTTGDERHRLVVSGLVRLPYDFMLSGIGNFASPTPFSVTVGQDLNDNGTFGDDWPGDERTQRPSNGWENWYRTVDLRLAKDFDIPVGAVTLSAEVFNVFNWTSWTGYFGRINDGSGNPLANFGEPSGVYAPREAQIGLRYRF